MLHYVPMYIYVCVFVFLCVRVGLHNISTLNSILMYKHIIINYPQMDLLGINHVWLSQWVNGVGGGVISFCVCVGMLCKYLFVLVIVWKLNGIICRNTKIKRKFFHNLIGLSVYIFYPGLIKFSIPKQWRCKKKKNFKYNS